MEKGENIKNNSEESICIICGDKLSFYSIGKCNHKEICYYCSIKNRLFYDDTKCPLCNTNLSLIFICPISEKKSFIDLSKEDLSSYYKWEEDSKDLGIYFTDITSYETALQLNAYKCPIEYCTKNDNFETFEELKNHLFLNHQKFFCKVCIKDGKKFISEQKVYDKNEIKEHNLYGDLEEDIPPHHFCPFCKELFYDDEILYKHMSNSHFMCDICKSTDKKILFYSALPNLIEHNTLYHYCCPFKECKEVLYIAFGSKKKLIEHFETKHNQKDNKTNEQMAEENMPKILEDPTFYDISLQKDEFNFGEYIQKVNKRCIQYRENKFKSNNDENDGKNINEDGIEIIYNNSPKNNSHNDDFNHKGKNKIRNNNNNFRGRGRGRGRRFRGNYNLSLQELKQDFNKYDDYDNSDKEEEEEEEYLKQNLIISLNNFVDLIKKYITERINQKKIFPKEINLPKETQYQIIMVIDKTNDYNKFLELFNIQIFGLDWDKINKFKEYLKHTESIKELELFSEFDSISIKNVLVLYKYLTIALKKIQGEFYKLDMEQIEEDLFNYFSNGVKIENKNNRNNSYQSYASFNLKQNLNEIKNKKNKKHNKNKFKWNQKIIPGLNDVKEKKQKTKLNKEQQMKKDFDKFVKQCQEEDEKLEKEKIQDNKEDKNDNKNNNKKSKLAMIMSSNDNKTKNNNKKKILINGGFKLSAFNMDEDFPPLK